MPRLCIGDLQCFQTFRNFSFSAPLGFYEISIVVMRIMLTMANIALIIISNIAHTVYIRLKAFGNFSKLQFAFTFWLLRKFYCGDAHHAIYGKHSLNHHLQHCAHSVYQINSVFKLLKISVCFTHFGFYEISTPVVRIILTKAKLFKSFPTLRTQCFSDLPRFETFRNCCLFCTFWRLRNFYSGDGPHGNCGEHCSSHHFPHWTHSVYQIYSVINLFEIAVFFAHLAFTKFLLWWCGSC